MTARLLVTGGRAITREQADQLERALDAFHLRTPIAVLIHGDCFHPVEPVRTRYSADQIANEWAARHGVHVAAFPVRKRIDGPWPAAGPRRNRRMVDEGKPTHVIAAVGGRGTADCLAYARKRVPAENVIDLGAAT